MIALYIKHKDAEAAKYELLKMRPEARPNGLIIQYADEIFTTRSGIESKLGKALGKLLRWDVPRRIESHFSEKNRTLLKERVDVNTKF